MILESVMILNKESRILFFLRKHQKDGAVYFKDLVRLVGLSKGWMTSILNELGENGLITSSMEGKRKKYMITEKGLMGVINALEVVLNEREISKINLK